MNHLDLNSREDMIKHYCPKGLGLEMGVYEGEFSKFILDNCPELNLIMLDCWEEQPRATYTDILNSPNKVQIERINKTLNNTINNYNRVKLIKGFSKEICRLLADNIFDFIFIDGNHSYKTAKEDLQNWYPKLKNGGLFSGHDYVDGYFGDNGTIPFGVKTAVDEFCVKNNIKLYSTNESWPSWFFIK